MGASLVATVFQGWADSWGNSWGSGDPNAMRGSASFSITGSLQVAAGEMQGSASFSITATLTLPLQNQFSAEVNLTPRRKYYVKRKKQILIFDSAEQADAFLDAERQAEETIQKAQKTSRLARKRLRTKIFKAIEQPEIVPIDYPEFRSIQLPEFTTQQDLAEFVRIALIARDIQDEEDLEAILMFL